MVEERRMRTGLPKKIGLILVIGMSFAIAFETVAFDMGKIYTYQYLRRGAKIGTEVFFLEKKRGHLIMKSDIDIGEANRYQRGNGELVFRKNGNPLAYSRYLDVQLPEMPAQNGVWELRYVFQGRNVAGEVTKDGLPQWKGTIEVEKGGVYCIDNNALCLLAVLVKAIYPELRREAMYSVKAFHFSEAGVRDVTFRKVKDGTYHCRIGRMDVGDLSIRHGIVLRHEDPARELVIRLKQ